MIYLREHLFLKCFVPQPFFLSIQTKERQVFAGTAGDYGQARTGRKLRLVIGTNTHHSPSGSPHEWVSILDYQCMNSDVYIVYVVC